MDTTAQIKTSTHLPHLSGQTISVELHPSRYARCLLNVLYAAGLCAVWLTAIDISGKIICFILALIWIAGYEMKSRKEAAITQITIAPNLRITATDKHGRVYNVNHIKFQYVFYHSVAMTIYLEKNIRKQLCVFTDSTDANSFRKLRAYALRQQRVNSKTI